ncbi:NADPH-dependent FMN reductase [Halalkalibacillus sediminis]|nr:NADPH-dependent FMN reductase [Halalkalibacillus sediminis]
MSVLVISGSGRDQSVSSVVGNWISSEFGFKHFNLSKNKLPVFDGSELTTESQNVQLMLTEMKKAEAIIMIAPEYHGAISGALKNALDYTNNDIFEEKPVLLLAVAGGGKGGINALNNLRTILRALYADVSPRQFVVDSDALDEPKLSENLFDCINGFLLKKSIFDRREVSDYTLSGGEL